MSKEELKEYAHLTITKTLVDVSIKFYETAGNSSIKEYELMKEVMGAEWYEAFFKLMHENANLIDKEIEDESEDLEIE